MAEELPGSGSALARKATLLLGEVLQAANRLLPLHHAARIQVGDLIAQQNPQGPVLILKPNDLGSAETL
jgi:hypothetical protein